jgi:hypothetical protein
VALSLTPNLYSIEIPLVPAAVLPLTVLNPIGHVALGCLAQEDVSTVQWLSDHREPTLPP